MFQRMDIIEKGRDEHARGRVDALMGVARRGVILTWASALFRTTHSGVPEK
jgi:hypothetical protein